MVRVLLCFALAQKSKQSPQKFPEDQIDRVVSNGTGYLCRGCAVMMEEVHRKIIDVTQHGARGETVKVLSWLRARCVEDEYSQYDKYIRMACDQLGGYGGEIGDLFNTGPPTPENLYSRTSDICIDQLGMCYPAPPTPPRAMSICRTCKTLMSDLQDVLTRKVDSFLSRQVLISLLVLQVEWAGYRQKGHVHAVLDTLCLELPMRYPSSKALRKMQVDYSAILKSLRLCYKNSVYSVMCMFFSLFSLCICP